MSLVHIYVGALILARISGLMVAMPGLSMRSMPKMVRVILIVCVTIVLVPTVPEQDYSPDLMLLSFDTIIEFLLGFMMGWMVNLIFNGLSMGTELISTQIGQAAAKQFNPSMATSQSRLSGKWMEKHPTKSTATRTAVSQVPRSRNGPWEDGGYIGQEEPDPANNTPTTK